MPTTRTVRTTGTAVTEEQITARYACNCNLVAGVHPAGQCARLRASTQP